MIIRISWLLPLLLSTCTFTFTSGGPLFLERSNKPLIQWSPPTDNWNWTMEPRNQEPFFMPMNFNHTLPPSANDTELVAHMASLRRNFSRLLWESEKSSNLPLFVEKALNLLNLKQVYYEVEHSVMSKVSCTACKAGAGLLQHYIRLGKSKEEINKMIYQFCVSLNIQSVRVCEGITRLFGSEVVYVLKRITIGPNEIWQFPVKLLEAPMEKTATFKVLQISDTHFDPYYAEGANAECNEPLCCRASSGPALTPGGGAGRWGDYRKCDTPKRTIDHMLKHIADTHTDIDYILWTGDLPPHDVWNQTKEENLKVLQETVAQMSDMFPGVPIFPALGNHESSPVNRPAMGSSVTGIKKCKEDEDTITLESGHMFYHQEGDQLSQGGVGFLVNKTLVNNVVEISSVSNRVAYLVIKLTERYIYSLKVVQRKWTWASPDGRTKNEKDFIMTDKRHIFRDVPVINRFKTGSDHRLLRGTLNINFKLERRCLVKSTLRPTLHQIGAVNTSF
ncbi:unnamed protein product [Plutella xylostella]|uniref:(diamondback moth) hypothetical protein n=1 Tax=Plutella xylostella TaxID=51655 RepID=A0A8S4EP16_PLUXY|nr:unnamed protein product [Plutella xylostella]